MELPRGCPVVVIVAAMALGGCQSAPASDGARVRYDGVVDARPEVRVNDAPPRIQEIVISRAAFASGDLVRIHAIASTNVAVLEMRTLGYGRAFVKRGYGRFECAFHIPLLPPMVRVSYPIRFRFIARNSAGAATEDAASIVVR